MKNPKIWATEKFHCSVCSKDTATVKPVLSYIIQQDIFLAFQTPGRLLLHESSAESSCMHYFNSAISNHLSIAISMARKWMVA